METGLNSKQSTMKHVPMGMLLTKQDLVDALDSRRLAARKHNGYQEMYEVAYEAAVRVRKGEIERPKYSDLQQDFFYKACEGSMFVPAKRFTSEQVELLGQIFSKVFYTLFVTKEAHEEIDSILRQVAEADPNGQIKVFYTKSFRYIYHTYESLVEELEGRRTVDLFVEADAINFLVSKYNDKLLQYAGDRLVVVY